MKKTMGLLVIMAFAFAFASIETQPKFKRQYVLSKSSSGHPAIFWYKNTEADLSGYTVFVQNWGAAPWIAYTTSDSFRVFYDDELKDSSVVCVDTFDWSGNHSRRSDTIKVALRLTLVPPPNLPPAAYDMPYTAPATWDGWMTSQKWPVRTQNNPNLYGLGIYTWYVPTNVYLSTHLTIDRKFNLPIGVITISFLGQADDDVIIAIEDLNGNVVSNATVKAGKRANYQASLGVSSPGTYWIRFKPTGSFFLGGYSHSGSTDITPPARTAGVGATIR